MIVHRSNRIEELVDALATLVADPLSDPFAPEWIAVQGRGMERWLAMELARRLAIWANPRFPFPRKVIDAAAASVLGPCAAETAIFEPDTLRWAVAEALPQYLDHPAFASIRRYLADDASGARRLQLAGRVADLFDQYAVYRPHLVLDWERGGGDHWQAELWRALVSTHGAEHAAARARALLAALDGGQTPGADFPPRISLFGLSTLPPLYVQILAALARSVELHLFVLSPSREYWGDVRSRRDTIRSLARRGPRAEQTNASAPQNIDHAGEEGHPLLASLGRVGRDFQHVLEELADYQDDGCDRYVDPGQDSVLAVLQSDVLALRLRGAGAVAEPVVLRPDDDSVAVHACHAPLREVEVLHDQLLALFDRDPTLSAADVVVLTPAIDLYAPLIESVFDSGGRPPIPCRIADRSARAQQEVVDAFLRALEVLRGRLSAPAVLDLLAMAPVRERFGLAVEQLERVRRWVSESGIRWAADAAHRAENGQPLSDQNTWRFGLDRLLLGYALPGQETLLFGGVLPYDDIEGSDAALLGRLAEFVATLDRFRLVLQEPRHPSLWREALADLLAALLHNSPATAYQHQALATALEELAASAVAAGFTGAIDLDAMRHLLEDAVETTGSPRGFLTGAVTFCELVPMRTIPFRVVCLLGLNDGAFPRPRRPLSFDLMAERPQAGDRTARDDDRYLFLEALLAAREHVLVTYVGQSISDNSELPPSVVVNELLDAIDRSFVVPTADSVAGVAARRRPRDCIVQRHALQPFSPHYFGADPEQRAFSYAAAQFEGAAALVAPDEAARPWLSAPLPIAEPEVVPLNDLIRFFDNPSRWFLQQRLGIYLGRDLDLLEEREPIELDALEKWRIGDGMLQRDLRDCDREAFWSLLRAGGALPLGAPGRCVFDELAPRAADLAAAVRERRAGERRTPLEIDLTVDGVRLTGTLSDLWPGGQIVVQYSRIGRHHELRLWVRHLALHAAQDSTTVSALVGRPAKDEGVASVCFAPVADPLPLLTDLLRLYRLGQRVPLRFFAHASRVFAEKMASARTEHAAWEAARDAFKPNEHRPSDSGDAYVAEIYPNDPPFEADAPDAISFADAALAVYAPFLRHREVRK